MYTSHRIIPCPGQVLPARSHGAVSLTAYLAFGLLNLDDIAEN